jgi:hypothetical protein
MGRNDEPEVVFDDVTVLAVSEFGLKCLIETEEVWIPKSEICEESELHKGSEPDDNGMLVIPAWLAQKEGL